MKWDPISKYSKFSVLPELVPHPGEAQSCLCPGAQERWACTLLVTIWKAVSLHGDPVSCLCLSDVFLIIGGARAPNDCKVLFIQTEHGEKCIFINAPIIPVPTRTKKKMCFACSQGRAIRIPCLSSPGSSFVICSHSRGAGLGSLQWLRFVCLLHRAQDAKPRKERRLLLRGWHTLPRAPVKS